MNIHYIEKNSHCSKTIIFLHGNSHSSQAFSNQLENPLFSLFRLIAIDLPGHGKSDVSDSYDFITLEHILSKFIKDLKLDSYIFVGHSFGGHMAIELLKSLNPMGLFIFGTAPASKPFDFSSFLPHTNSELFMGSPFSEQQVNELGRSIGYPEETLQQFVGDFFKTSVDFRKSISSTIVEENYQDECLLLSQFKGKLHFIINKNEKLVCNEYIKKLIDKVQCTYNVLNSEHGPHLEVSEEFNESLLSFVFSVFEYEMKIYHMDSVSSHEGA